MGKLIVEIKETIYETTGPVRYFAGTAYVILQRG
jgi:hypothetical protein